MKKRKHHSKRCVSLPIYGVYRKDLGNLYFLGSVVNSNPVEAIKWFIESSPRLASIDDSELFYAEIGRRRFRDDVQEDIINFDSFIIQPVYKNHETV